MIGNVQDMARRIMAVLPQNWFADDAPVVGAVSQGFGSAMAAVYGLIQFVIGQSRILTASGIFLDAISADFFGSDVTRRPGEADVPFQKRICQNLLRPMATRSALVTALAELTGADPIIFEPARTSDTGGYRVGGVAYGVSGGWGNLALPYQLFITIARPVGGGIAQLAGYGTGGIPVYGSVSWETANISDAELFAAVPPLLPAGTIAWCRLSG